MAGQDYQWRGQRWFGHVKRRDENSILRINNGIHWVAWVSYSSSSSSLFIVPSFPLLELLPLFSILCHIFHDIYNFLMSSSTTLLQVLFGLPTGLLPSTSSSITLLSMLFSLIPTFYMTKPSQHHFLNLCSRLTTPHLLLNSSFVILSSNPMEDRF